MGICVKRVFHIIRIGFKIYRNISNRKNHFTTNISGLPRPRRYDSCFIKSFRSVKYNTRLNKRLNKYD